MEWENDGKSPYHGIVVSCIMFIVLPIAVSALFMWLFNDKESFPKEFNDAAAIALGSGVGTIFHITCVMLGLLKKPFNAVKKRIIEFIDDFSISKKMAFKGWLLNVKIDGIVFWIYITIMIIVFVICINNVLYCYNYWIKYQNLIS